MPAIDGSNQEGAREYGSVTRGTPEATYREPRDGATFDGVLARVNDERMSGVRQGGVVVGD